MVQGKSEGGKTKNESSGMSFTISDSVNHIMNHVHKLKLCFWSCNIYTFLFVSCRSGSNQSPDFRAGDPCPGSSEDSSVCPQLSEEHLLFSS